jgi:hypothetical protein
MRQRLSPHLLFVLCALLGLTLALGSRATPLGAEEPPKKPAGDPKPGADGDGEEGEDDDPDDFFEGETSFSAKQVSLAIDKGVQWLRKKQGRDGSWGDMSGGQAYGGGGQGNGYPHPAGPTALALYTLLKCKVPVKDNCITRGFDFLEKSGNDIPGSSYECSMVLLAVTATADQAKTLKASDKSNAKDKLTGKMRGWAQKLVNELLDRRQSHGVWRYNLKLKSGSAQAPPGGDEDLSSTQLAALALFAAHRAGIKVRDDVWEGILEYAMAQQDETGPDMPQEDPVTKKKEIWKARGFAYIKGMEDPEEGQAVGSMTACGVGCVQMARFILSDGGRKRAQWDARKDAQKVQESVQDGLAWLEQNWSPFDNPKKSRQNIYTIYWLYSFERMMDLIGKQLLGKHPWYSEMGQQLLNRQNADGHWKTGTTLEPQDTLDTCFALLFLKRATKGAIPNPSITGGSDDAPADNR